LLFPVWKL